MPVSPACLRAVLTAAFAAIALWLLVSPDRAEANVGCNITGGTGTLNFGNAKTVTATVNYSCTNYGTSARSVTLCLGVGISSYPGTQSQPQMQNTTTATPLNYNVYKDSATNQIWSTTSPITMSITFPAGRTTTGTFTYYAKIGAGQNVPLGNYQGQLFNNRLGYINGGSCQMNVGDLAGVEFTTQVAATLVASCDLGTIGRIDFGTQPGLPNRVDATGAVQLTCPTGLAWTLSFDGGRNASFGVRRMRSSLGGYVTYRIYRDSNRVSVIAIDGTITGTGNGAPRTVPIYGRVEAASPPRVGLYQDFIVVTLSF